MSRRDSYEGESPYGARIDGAALISSFEGDYAFLSNFWPYVVTKISGGRFVRGEYVEPPFDVKGKLVKTAEHAFQAQKTRDPEWRENVLGQLTPGRAKRMGRRVPLREGWDDIKVSVMRQILACKFAPGTERAAWLVATYPNHLIEGNAWGDIFWGCVHPTEGSNLWVGANYLGILLMERRDELMKEGA